MEDFRDFIKNKKNLFGLLVLLILIVSLYAFITVRQSQIIKSRAAADPIVVTGTNVVDLPGGKKGFKLNADGKAVVGVELTSPLGPPSATSSGSPAPSPSP